MQLTPTSPQASQDVIKALEKAITHYKKSSEDSERKAKLWHKEAIYYAKELATYRMLAAIFCAISIISIVLLNSK